MYNNIEDFIKEMSDKSKDKNIRVGLIDDYFVILVPESVKSVNTSFVEKDGNGFVCVSVEYLDTTVKHNYPCPDSALYILIVYIP